MTGFAETKVSYPPLLMGKTSKCVKHRSHVSSRECGHIHWSVLMRIIGVFLGLFAIAGFSHVRNVIPFLILMYNFQEIQFSGTFRQTDKFTKNENSSGDNCQFLIFRNISTCPNFFHFSILILGIQN